MDKKLTAKHLEVLLNLWNNKEPVRYIKLLPDLNPVLDLIEYNLVNKKEESYKLSDKGKEYLDKIFQRILEDIENELFN